MMPNAECLAYLLALTIGFTLTFILLRIEQRGPCTTVHVQEQ